MLHWLLRDIILPLDDLTNVAKKGIILMEDAAHSTPIGGDGGNSAITNAVALAEWISSQGVEGLREFYGQRFAEWEWEIKEREKILEGIHSMANYLLLLGLR